METENCDQEARRHREAVYGQISDEGWQKIKVHWICDLDWLRKTNLRQSAKSADKPL